MLKIFIKREVPAPGEIGWTILLYGEKWVPVRCIIKESHIQVNARSGISVLCHIKIDDGDRYIMRNTEYIFDTKEEAIQEADDLNKK